MINIVPCALIQEVKDNTILNCYEEHGYKFTFIPFNIIRDLVYLTIYRNTGTLSVKNVNSQSEYVKILLEILHICDKYDNLPKNPLHKVITILDKVINKYDFRLLEEARNSDIYVKPVKVNNSLLLFEDVPDILLKTMDIMTQEQLNELAEIIINCGFMIDVFKSPTFINDKNRAVSKMTSYSNLNLSKKYKLALPYFSVLYSLKSLHVNTNILGKDVPSKKLLILVDRSESMQNNYVNTYLEALKLECYKTIGVQFKEVEIACLYPSESAYRKGITFNNKEDLQNFKFDSLEIISGVLKINNIFRSIPNTITDVLIVTDGRDHLYLETYKFTLSTCLVNGSSEVYKNLSKLNKGFYIELIHNE